MGDMSRSRSNFKVKVKLKLSLVPTGGHSVSQTHLVIVYSFSSEAQPGKECSPCDTSMKFTRNSRQGVQNRNMSLVK